MSSSKSKVNSSEDFWNALEGRYGEVPNLIKLILQINGFDSYLALKGIRYEDKQEFFQSLELTVLEILNSDFDGADKRELEAELGCYQNANNFRIKPGHRNYIMNLMMEIEKSDVQDFFGQEQSSLTYDVLKTPPSKAESRSKQEYEIAQLNLPELSSNRFLVRGLSEKAIILNQVEHGYSRDDQEESEYILEEEYLTDETGDAMDGIDSLIKLEYDPSSSSNSSQRKRQRKPSTSTPSSKRKPQHMYNDEFMNKSINPRRRRVTLNKTYPKTDEGTRERFSDLIHQSMQCILPSDKLADVENADIELEKESDFSWAVYCPLCHSRIRLPVVFENGGRYCNYKRSNFERHLRFKHCKDNDKTKLKSDQVFEHVEMIEEIVDQ